MNANKTTRGQAVPNHRRRKDKESENNIDLAAHSQTLEQQRQVNDRNHHIPININTECQWTKLPFGKLDKKEDPTICPLQETHLIDRNIHWLRVKTWKIYQANGPQKQAEVAILISDKVDFKLTLIKGDKEDTPC
jgi:hypothetical protein